MKTIINIHNVQINRSDTFRLEIPELAVQRGTVLCVSGPNGSGKSTLLQCIVGLTAPDKGHVVINGIPVSSNIRVTKTAIGYVPDDEDWLIKQLCASEYFDVLVRIYRDAGMKHDLKKRVHLLCNMLDFHSFVQPLATLSHGNKKKVQLVAGLMHKPDCIILDEVRNGLDPLAIIVTEKLLQAEAQRGAAIVATTHDLPWAERMADNVLLLGNGQIQYYGKKNDITETYGSLERLFLHTAGIGADI